MRHPFSHRYEMVTSFRWAFRENGVYCQALYRTHQQPCSRVRHLEACEAMAERKLLRPKAVEEIYDISEGHQAKMRCAGGGPEYIKLGSKIYYEEAAIQS